ncbi:PREDICTED: O-acetyl-ADP-ribose deacetylase MACROD1 [Gekko japonicus]|uniref:O-acetyl-ADP-ribose deacetylase MACROD1 n=1 Tax=Gekko japonicus TaxID=146911 RepID=A0ABM1KF06_GEKJA|nr:PREDICTED: O-acetyl-ADP-ribose deacetylase MACROD1 [Gekko japonicus]
MPGFLLPLQISRLSGALGRLWRVWGSCPVTLQGGGRQGVCSGGGVPVRRVPAHWGFARGIRSWAAAPLAMAAKVDLTTSTDWKEAKSFLKGLSAKQRRDHYFTKDFIKLKQMPSWKEMAKSARVKPPEEAVYPKDNHLNEKISLFRGDITKLEVDAIVNADQGPGQENCQAVVPGSSVVVTPFGTFSPLPWLVPLLLQAFPRVEL